MISDGGSSSAVLTSSCVTPIAILVTGLVYRNMISSVVYWLNIIFIVKDLTIWSQFSMLDF